jgi:hypothetical protein
MIQSRFDGFTRQLGRRGALQALGAAAAATASGVSLAGAKKGKSNRQKNQQRKKKQEKLQQRIDQESLALCAGQVPECVTLLTANCDGSASCVATGQTCCQELADCDFSGLVTCFAQQNNT